MAQLTIYLDDATRQRIETAARDEGLSVSRWVCRKIQDALIHDWPEGYFENFGKLAESDLERPPQGELEHDLPRETLD